MINKKTIIVLLIFLFSMVTHAAEKSRFHVFGHIGPVFTISPWFDKEVYPSTIEFGGGLGYKFSKMFTLELNITRSRFKNVTDNTDLFINSGIFLTGPVISTTILEYTSILLNLKISPFKGRLSPYLTIGGGGLFEKHSFKLTISDRDESFYYSDFRIYSGIGVQYQISQRLDCFIEAGYYYSFMNFHSTLYKHMPIKLGVLYRL